jgi:hypothetical protein
MAALVSSAEEGAELMSLAARRTTAQALALRARIVLRCATEAENQQVAADLRIDTTTFRTAAASDCGGMLSYFSANPELRDIDPDRIQSNGV